MAEPGEPQCTETKIHRGGDGKVAIIDYGKVSSGYSINITRTYTIPGHWTEDQVTAFEDATLDQFKVRVDQVLDAEFQERWAQKVWEDDR